MSADSPPSATSPPPVSALAPPQSAMLTPLQEVQRFDPSAPTATPRIDHDLTPTRKNMQAYSSTLSSQPVNPASPPSSALASPFLAVPLPSSTSSSNNISQTPSSNSHPTLIPPSPIPRRLTRNPFVRSLSQQHTVTTNTVQLGLGLGFGSDSQHIGQDPTTPTQPTHSSADPFLLRPSLQEDEPAHRFSMDNIGIGLMEIDFDLDNFSADDGGRELLRVERERRKRSFEMHS
ncbi:hypothetical protein OC861_006009 [Tilletia horrida]|nr:hypothetical protein OC861_006009 [Tilletia horrida]